MDNLFRPEIFTEDVKRPEEIKLVEDLIQELLKAKKQMRTYPPNNPIYINACRTLHDRFKKFFDLNNKLVLKIHQNEILYKKEQVYYNPEKDENLALFLFKDGIIELALLKGLTQEELEDFIKILNTDFETEVIDDDVVTALWARNFEHIKYVVDENFLDNWEITHESKISDEAIATAYQDALKKEVEKTKISIHPNDIDFQYIAEEIRRQNQPKLKKIITILFELLYQVKEISEFTELVKFIEATILHCIRRGNFKDASYTLDLIKTAIEDKIAGDEGVKTLKAIYNAINGKTFIEEIGKVLDSKAVIEENNFILYIKHLNASAIPFFMNLLGEIQDIKGRRLIIETLTILGRLDIKAISKGLHDSRWYVVRNTAFILGRIATPDCIRYLSEILSHPDQRVRKEAVKAIGSTKGPDTPRYLKNALNDSVQSIRITAARALGSIKTEDAKKVLLDELVKKDFLKRDFAEKKEFYEAIACHQDEEVKDFLIKTLNKKKFFGKTKNDETRACAAHALGILNAKDTIPMLKKTSTSKTKVLRELSLSALRKLEA